MNKAAFLLLFFILFNAFAKAQESDEKYGIIPKPNTLIAKEGNFSLNAQTKIYYQNEVIKPIAVFLKDFLNQESNINLDLQPYAKQDLSNAIYLSFPANNFSEEEYELDVSAQTILLKGKEKGLFYAMQSLSQIILTNKSLQIPQVKIIDKPAFEYRGLHLDVCRHFFPIVFIKKYIDLMAMYKLNNFHWHLTDDQAWRIEIKKYKELTDLASKRSGTLIGNYHEFFPQIFDQQPVSGYYTQEQAKEIVAYAAERFINVIPEIEMPGHAVAALSAYPHLACGDNPGPFSPEQKWGVFPDIFCAGKETTFTFVEDVLTEVMDIFPSKYIHIGGDEAPKDRWKKCKYCQQRIKNQKLKNEDHLQSYFIHRVEKFVNSKGRLIIGWDEILDGGLAPNATVMSWRGEKGGITAAKQGNYVLMTPSTRGLYFDHRQSYDANEPLTIGGIGTIDMVYNYNPIPASLTPTQHKYIKGVQANLWAEYLTTENKVWYTLLPKLLALSEIAWTNNNNKNYTDFTNNRLAKHLSYFDSKNYVYRVPTPANAKDTTINVTDKYTFKWKTPFKDCVIYYTLDGRNPDETTAVYNGHSLDVFVPKGEKRVVKCIVVTPNNRRSTILTTTLINQEPFEALKLDFIPNKGFWNYAYIPGVFNTVLEIDTTLATKKGKVDAVNLAKIPNKQRRDFAVVYTGYINVNEDGIFEFTLFSDAGSCLYIDDKLVVNNDGRHFRREEGAGVPLKAGLHKIKLSYFDDGPSNTLKLYIRGTDGVRIEIPSVMMYN